jgi:O-antigen polymerase
MKLSSIAKISQSTIVAVLLLILLLVVSPLYTQPNISGIGGLALPYNIPQWAISTWIIAYAVFTITKLKQLQLPTNYYFIIAFPVVVVLGGLLAEITDPTTWLFRQFYILGGLFFLFSLFQFKLKQRSIDTTLILLIVAMALHAIIGVINIVEPKESIGWFQASIDGSPRGIFQQINVQASYLATGMVISLYLVSRPFFRSTPLLTKVALMASFGLSNYIVIYSGSRVGLLSLILGLLLVLFSRRKQLFSQKAILSLLLIITIGTSFLAQEGFNRTLDKTNVLTKGEYSSARLSMYSIGLELVKKEPFSGHGIGSFLRVWNKEAADFHGKHPGAALPEYVGHPHNEILFWLIEGGILAFIGIILFIIGVTLALVKCGLQRGGSYLAMLLPIGMHTQVEMPFYTSSVHWFLWLFLIFIVLRHHQKTVQVRITKSATMLLQLATLSFTVGTSYFMIHSDRSQTDIYNYLYNKDVKPPYLQIAYNNLYFRSLADKVAMRSLLYDSIKNDDREIVLVYLSWAESYLQVTPEPEIFGDLAKLHSYMKTDKDACVLIKQGLNMYPRYLELQDAAASCKLMESVPNKS